LGKRPQLEDYLEYVREGDTLVVTRLDRLARPTLHPCQIADELARKGVHLQVLDQHLDTSDATGRLLFNMLGAVSQFETEIRAEAEQRGVRFGPKTKLTPEQIMELQHRREHGTFIKDLMHDYDISKVIVYRYLGEANASVTLVDA
jgi:DNA invertase Pin-like site-specific DNA recombinase